MSDLLIQARMRLEEAIRTRELAERQERVNPWSARHREAAAAARRRQHVLAGEVLRLEGQRELGL